jgi:hypothetical protein
MIDENIARYLSQLETADRHGDAIPEAKVDRLKGKIEKLTNSAWFQQLTRAPSMKAGPSTGAASSLFLLQKLRVASSGTSYRCPAAGHAGQQGPFTSRRCQKSQLTAIGGS